MSAAAEDEARRAHWARYCPTTEHLTSLAEVTHVVDYPGASRGVRVCAACASVAAGKRYPVRPLVTL